MHIEKFIGQKLIDVIAKHPDLKYQIIQINHQVDMPWFNQFFKGLNIALSDVLVINVEIFDRENKKFTTKTLANLEQGIVSNCFWT